MKVENLEKAVKLADQLRVINIRIQSVEKATNVEFTGNTFIMGSAKMKYDGAILLESIKPLFIISLLREKQDILNEIEKID
jgi:hypothetical protein